MKGAISWHKYSEIEALLNYQPTAPPPPPPRRNTNAREVGGLIGSMGQFAADVTGVEVDNLRDIGEVFGSGVDVAADYMQQQEPTHTQSYAAARRLKHQADVYNQRATASELDQEANYNRAHYTL